VVGRQDLQKQAWQRGGLKALERAGRNVGGMSAAWCPRTWRCWKRSRTADCWPAVSAVSQAEGAFNHTKDWATDPGAERLSFFSNSLVLIFPLGLTAIMRSRKSASSARSVSSHLSFPKHCTVTVKESQVALSIFGPAPWWVQAPE
jgi:hypothetical protein